MTLPGPPPSRPQTTIERVAQLERMIRAMQAAPKLSTSRDSVLFGDDLSTCPRVSVQNAGASMTLNTPRGILLYTPVPTSAISRCSFAVQNSSVSAATVAAAVYVGTNPTSLALWGSGTVAVTASVSDEYDVTLNNTGPLPAGYVLAIAQATAVGATVPSLAIAGQGPSDLFLGMDQTGPIFTTLVGATTMTPWPSTQSVATSNTAVWSASQFSCWLALG